MTQPLFDSLPKIAWSVRNAPHVLLSLDFDGTLAPIDVNPGAALMPAESRRALKALEASERCTVAIISGRALPDLRERVRMEEIIYAGNHGLEITGPGLHFIEPSAAQRVEALEELARHLQVRLRHIPGVEVESKVLTASIHFRRASPNKLDEVHKLVLEAVAPIVSLFQVTQGLQIFEIRPRVNWHKGMAVRWIKQALGRGDALSIYLGDDVSDEDAFATLRDDITISVGRVSGTCAQYHIDLQESVQEFLVWLAGCLGSATAVAHQRA
ncbi:MAG TPA: trehalose-phosphatase [Bryobacteraceae bacterium]|jgi:trehalose 6-phosphate phosphatase|nr:trehalose-phosphatase [Bryobacteraceae bacterium]